MISNILNVHTYGCIVIATTQLRVALRLVGLPQTQRFTPTPCTREESGSAVDTLPSVYCFTQRIRLPPPPNARVWGIELMDDGAAILVVLQFLISRLGLPNITEWQANPL